MDMILKGKGYFTWILSRTEGGNPAAIASLAKAANYTHVLIKISDGVVPFNIDYTTGIDYAMLVTNALKSVGIKVWGWHYVYGDSPVNEANQAISRIRQLNVDGYVINAEVEYKRPNRRVAARTFMDRLRSVLPNMPIALSSYRYPSYHPELPWREFLEYCDIAMPQVYWMKATNAGQQLERSVREYQAMTPYRPIVPTGSAFAEHGWRPYLPQVLEFLNTAKSLNLKAVNFWEWYNTRTRLPEIWDGIRNYPWDTPAPTDISERYIEALNSRNPMKVSELYADKAVHITSARTIQGRAAITTWYQTLFNQILPNASFTLTRYTGTGSSRHLTWTAVSPKGRVQNGSDTLGIINNSIMYHYTFFNVSP
jgi:hypothetical protein